MTVSRIDIVNKSFGKRLRGYDVTQVDFFMQEVAETVGKLAEERKLLLARITDLEASLEEHRGRERTLRDTLVTTQKMTDELKATAQREAQLIIDAANAKSDSLLNHAHMRVAQVHEDISDLKRIRAQFDMKVRSVIDSYLALLDMGQKEEEELDAAESKVKYLTKKAENA
ncbi:MAG: DivIVA domain-containing protein [Desulfovibrionaceae bacterium]